MKSPASRYSFVWILRSSLGQVIAHAGLEVHGQLERSVLAEELAALGVLEVVLAYDALNRLRSTQVEPQGGGVQETLTMDYDDTAADGRRGQMVSATAKNAALAYTFGYDAFGRRISEQLAYSGLSTQGLTQYTYDLADRIEEIRHGTVAQPNLWVTGNVRDAVGLITGIKDRRTTPLDVVGSVQHAPFGPYQAMTFGNGRQMTRTLDPRYRVSAWTVSGIDQRTLTWTADDNVGASTASVFYYSPTYQYAYDPMNRLALLSPARACT